MKLVSVETQIIKATIAALLDENYQIAVIDGEEVALANFQSPFKRSWPTRWERSLVRRYRARVDALDCPDRAAWR